MPTLRERLDALLDEQEEAVRRAFLSFIASVNSEHVWAVIVDHLERGDVRAAMAIVDSYIVRFADVVPVIQQAVGMATAAELTETVGGVVAAIGFDASHPRAAQLARVARLNLIRGMVAEQRETIREALASAFDSGTGTAATARAFRNAIGITSEQQKWVSSFERGLRERDAAVLRRKLRDRRFDRTIEAAIDNDRPLSEAQIATMVDRYRSRLLIYRSENIARTEALRSTSRAREEALRQMTEQTGIDPSRIVRVWNATNDRRTRDSHAEMDEQKRPVDVPFEDGAGNSLMWPGDPAAPPETTINCRCVVTFSIRPPE